MNLVLHILSVLLLDLLSVVGTTQLIEVLINYIILTILNLLNKMKKIYELALKSASITNENVFTLIDAMEERLQENAVLLITGNLDIPETCVKGFNAEVVIDDEKVIATVDNNTILEQEVKLTWNDKDNVRRYRYFSYQRWDELVKKYK